VIVYLLYNELFAVTFNEEQANITGIKSDNINLLLVILTAITVVLSVRVVGIMLVSSFFILPAVTALQISKGFKSAIFVSALVAVVSVITGICASFYLDLPAGASIVIVNFILFLLSFLWRKNM
jgi:zinc transport system permease protein